MDDARKQRIIEALSSKGLQACPRCRNSNFEFLGETFLGLQDQPGTLVIGGPSIPVALVACTNCGFISQHALGALGLLKGAK